MLENEKIASEQAKEILISMINAGKFTYPITDKTSAESVASFTADYYKILYDALLGKFKGNK